MIGAITGDTIGSVYEFNNTRDYNFELLKPRSIYTDDSVMTIATAEWLLRDPSQNAKNLGRFFKSYAEEYPCPMGGYGGNFHRWLCGSLQDGYGSYGNGSAMRCSACGWWADTLEETERIAGISAEITHNHPEGIKGAMATSVAIFLARKDNSKEQIRSTIETRYGYDLKRSYEDLHYSYKWDSSCQGTVPEAIIAFLDSENFEDAIRKAVSMGGDSDTLACITGAISEAFYGGVPKEIASKVWERLPEDFKTIITEFSQRTSYKGFRL